MKIEPWILRLAATMLDEYSERLENDGCNDFYPPEGISQKQIVVLVKDFHPDSVGGWDDDDAEGIAGNNWGVVDALAEYLRQLSKNP